MIYVKTFIWGILIGILVFIIALFATPDLTHSCSKGLIGCMNEAAAMPLGAKIGAGIGCVFNNVWCVLTALL